MPRADLMSFIWLTASNTFALSFSFFSRLLYDYLVKFLIIYRQYQSHNSLKLTQDVLERIESNHWLSDGKIMCGGRMVPHGLIIGKYLRFFALVHVNASSDDHSSVTPGKDITVWTWRWDDPVIPDVTTETIDDHSEKEIDITGEGCVNVLRMNLYAFYTCRKECAYPTSCPTLAQSTAMANEMYTCWLENKKQGRFVISGPPGTGKSMAVRILAYKVGGTLCPYYNPTKPRVSIEEMIDATKLSREHPLVIAMDEFDQCLDKFTHANPSMDRNPVELGTKSDWTNLMDYLQFRRDIIMVMTTNKTFAEIDDIDKKHFEGALLRPGRVTNRFLMP